MGKRKRKSMVLILVGMMGVIEACGGTVSTISEIEEIESITESSAWESTVLETEETVEESISLETMAESMPDETESLVGEPRRPIGHQIVYEDGEIYGWTRYEYDKNGRRVMTIFLSPRGEEYWSPDCYDGNGHMIPEALGDWSTRDENGLYLQVGTEDSKGRRKVTAEYVYDAKGNLTDYWYMFVEGKALRHTIYTYDEQDRILRMEVYNQKTKRRETAEIYTYNREQLLYKAVTEDPDRQGTTIYTYYRYDELGRLIREEQLKGGAVSDYIQYTYNDVGELLREYHYLEDPMMGGAFTVEYLYEEIENPEIN